MQKFDTIFSDLLEKSETVMHHTKLTSNIPIKVRPYPISIHYEEKSRTRN